MREGVKMHFLAAPASVSRANGTLRLQCQRMRLGQVDASGRPRPEPIPGDLFELEVDSVIAAIGQRPSLPSRLTLPTGRGNTLEADPYTLATERPGVFGGGDVVSGPASVIEAIAHGRQAAISIDKYLGGSGDIAEVLIPPELGKSMPELAVSEEEQRRPPMPTFPVGERLAGFAEVELGYSAEAAVAEARRCLNCDLED